MRFEYDYIHPFVRRKKFFRCQITVAIIFLAYRVCLNLRFFGECRHSRNCFFVSGVKWWKVLLFEHNARKILGKPWYVDGCGPPLAFTALIWHKLSDTDTFEIYVSRNVSDQKCKFPVSRPWRHLVSSNFLAISSEIDRLFFHRNLPCESPLHHFRMFSMSSFTALAVHITQLCIWTSFGRSPFSLKRKKQILF